MSVDTFTTAGATTWTCPALVTVAKFEVWAAGGGAGDDNVNGGAGGGGGGYAITLAQPVVPGRVYDVVVGTKGAAGTGGGGGSNGSESNITFTSGGTTVYCRALGGNSGGGAGGLPGTGGAGIVGDTLYTGGTGAANVANNGGGGGSSAGTGSNGNNGSGTSGGAAPAGGGAGGDHNAAGVQPGGGGGGADSLAAPGAGGDGKVVITYTAGDAIENTGLRLTIETPSPPPFPGGVNQILNQYGVPAAAVTSGESNQFKVSTPSPSPFEGGVATILNRAPVQAELTRVTYPPPIQTPSPLPFPGEARRGSLNRFGLPPVANARPIRVELLAVPSFEGGLIVGRPRVQEVRDLLPAPIIARQVEPVVELRQPVFWNGVHERPAVSPPIRIAVGDPAPAFPGNSVFRRSDFGLSSLPPVRPVVVKIAEGTFSDPGRAIFLSERPQAQPIARTIVARASLDLPRELQQPVFWAGTHERPAATSPIPVASIPSPPPFPGATITSKAAFGLFPIPSRPVRIQMPEGGLPIEPGRVIFKRASPTDPIRRNAPAVVTVLPFTPFAGANYTSFGVAKPVVRAPGPMLAWGDTTYPEVQQPFFGWGWRTGTGAPPDPDTGFPVVLLGYDTSTLTISSLDCECGQ